MSIVAARANPVRGFAVSGSSFQVIIAWLAVLWSVIDHAAGSLVLTMSAIDRMTLTVPGILCANSKHAAERLMQTLIFCNNVAQNRIIPDQSIHLSCSARLLASSISGCTIGTGRRLFGHFGREVALFWQFLVATLSATE